MSTQEEEAGAAADAPDSVQRAGGLQGTFTHDKPLALKAVFGTYLRDLAQGRGSRAYRANADDALDPAESHIGFVVTAPGQTMLPSVSVPKDTVAKFEEAAAPEPELEPQGLRSMP